MNSDTLREKRAVTGTKTEPRSTTRFIPAWAPLRTPIFRALWLAAMASNLGTWMQEVGASWLMTSLAARADMVALVQAAATIPIFLLALPAGALADVVDRRKLIIAAQVWMVLTASALGVMTLMHSVQPWTLLAFTFLLSIGGAISMPAWQGIIPEMVKRAELSQAVALGGIAFNLTRIVGPALGGLIIYAASLKLGKLAAPSAVFLLNALSFLGVIVVLSRWHRPERVSDMPPEHVTGAIRAGARYVRHAPELRDLLVRLAGFVFFGAAMWAIVPLYARQELHLTAAGYGGLLGCIGAGAVTGGLALSRVRRRFSADAMVTLGMAGAAIHLVVMALTRNLLLVQLAMVVAGVWWTWVMLNCNIAVLRVAPEWVRSRASATYLLVQMGCHAAGATLWGFIGQQWGISNSLTVAAAGMGLSAVLLRRFSVSETGQNLLPSSHWPEPVLEFEPAPEDGPVLVTVEYEIDPEQTADFIQAMQPVRLTRLRDGALRWNLWQDASQPTRWLESMLVESWNEHLRQQARATLADREVEVAAWSYHRGEEPPRVTHMIAASARMKEEE